MRYIIRLSSICSSNYCYFFVNFTYAYYFQYVIPQSQPSGCRKQLNDKLSKNHYIPKMKTDLTFCIVYVLLTCRLKYLWLFFSIIKDPSLIEINDTSEEQTLSVSMKNRHLSGDVEHVCQHSFYSSQFSTRVTNSGKLDYIRVKWYFSCCLLRITFSNISWNIIVNDVFPGFSSNVFSKEKSPWLSRINVQLSIHLSRVSRFSRFFSVSFEFVRIVLVFLTRNIAIFSW